MDKMKEVQDRSRKYYEQIGVAMTCRSFEEYLRMFALSDDLLQDGPILDVAGGASSFTAEASKRGYIAFAADPQYGLSAQELLIRGQQEIEVSSKKIAELADCFQWDYYGNPEKHRKNREISLQLFAEDFDSIQFAERYYPATLPELPFDNSTFSLVLCSHFLFLYEEQFDYAFHLSAVLELLRVCKTGGEVRIYPVYNLRREPYSQLDELIAALNDQAVRVDLTDSHLPFIPGSKHMLRLLK